MPALSGRSHIPAFFWIAHVCDDSHLRAEKHLIVALSIEVETALTNGLVAALIGKRTEIEQWPEEGYLTEGMS